MTSRPSSAERGSRLPAAGVADTCWVIPGTPYRAGRLSMVSPESRHRGMAGLARVVGQAGKRAGRDERTARPTADDGSVARWGQERVEGRIR